MLFNSPEYLLFFFATLAASWAVVGMPRLRIWILLLASYYFYVANNHWLLVLIIVSTQVDYMAGLGIQKSRSPRMRRLYLVLSVATNLGILAWFKYFNFFASTVAGLAAAAGVELRWTDLHILLPVGVSFYTFQSMSYTIDVYRGRISAEPSWYRFAFYVAFFPQLVAGPIMRASYFLPQVGRRPSLSTRELDRALYLIFLGLAKKIVFAGFLATYADMAFNGAAGGDTISSWVGVYAFSFQIYFDFSGYTDIAIGCSLLLGFRLPENFRRPYAAGSFGEFWQRWHISLSTWLRDYLYIPLGGNRVGGRSGLARNLFITMFLGGLWHGAAWHFVLWGSAHGLFLVVERMIARPSRESARKQGLAGLLRRLWIFNAVTFTWILFRAENMHSFADLLNVMFSFQSTRAFSLGTALAAAVIAASWLAQLAGEKYRPDEVFLKSPAALKGLVYAALWLVILVFNAEGSQPFIYFKF